MADAGYRRDVPPAEQGEEARERTESRTRLSASMLDAPVQGDRSVSVANMDRAEFRNEVARSVQTMSQTLGAASDAMSTFNRAALSGQIRPGTEEYSRAFQAATAGYRQAIEQAAGQLFRDGGNGQATPTEMSRRVAQERQQTENEIRALRVLAQGGGQLTADQARQLGVNTTDSRQALRQKSQDLMTLDDFQRSLGDAQANFGLALIRSTASLPQSLKLQQAREGEQWIARAAQADPNMARDENFWQNYMYVYQKAGMQPQRQLPDSVQPTGGLPGNRQGDTPIGPTGGLDQPVRPAGDVQGTGPNGRYRLPTGNMRPDSQGYVDPLRAIDEADRSVSGPLNADNVARYQAAMRAADSLDRNYLRQRIAEGQGAMTQALNGDNNLLARVQAKRSLLQANSQIDQGLGANRNAITQAVGDGVQPLLTALQSQRSVGDLRNLMTQEPDAISAIARAPQGQQFLQSVQRRAANSERLGQLDQEIGQINPQFQQTWNETQRNERLYTSSLDARAHALRAVVAAGGNSPETVGAARGLMLEMAQMDRGLLQRSDFLQTARQFGLTTDQLAGRANAPAVAGADRSNGPTDAQLERLSPSGGQNATPPERAAALYRQVMGHVRQGQPITAAEQQSFQQLMDAAGRTEPEQMRLEAQRLQRLSTDLGRGAPVEQRMEELMRQPQGGQAAVDRYKAQPEIRDYLDTKFRFNMVAHGQRVVEGLYGLALLRGTNDPESQRRAGAMITNANLDEFARSVLPLNDAINAMSPNRVVPGQRPGAPEVRPSAADVPLPAPAGQDQGNDPGAAREQRLQASVPGYAEYTRAVLAATQGNVNPIEGLNRSRQAFETAMAATATINAQEQARTAQQNRERGDIARAELVGMTEEQARANPQATQEKLANYQRLRIAEDNAQTAANLPTQVRLTYAATLNRAAMELYTQAGRDSARRAELERQADQYNQSAIRILQQTRTNDPTFGQTDPDARSRMGHMIDGAIQQAQERRQIQADSAIAQQYVRDARVAVDMGVNAPGGVRGLQPVVAAFNMGGPVTEVAGFPTFTNYQRPAAVMALARGYHADEQAAAAAVQEQQNQHRTGLVHAGIDLIAGPAGVYAAERILPRVAAFIPANPLVKGAVSLALTGGITYGLDRAANQTLGTGTLSTNEWLSHSTASWGASWAVRGITGWRASNAAAAANEGSAARAMSSFTPEFRAGIRVTEGAAEATRAAEVARGITSARSAAASAFNDARAAQYSSFNPQRYLGGNVRVTEEMLTANRALGATNLPAVGSTVSKSEWVGTLGVQNGSPMAFLNPANMQAGLMQRTLSVGADGRLAGTAWDVSARRLYSTIMPHAVAGAAASGIYSTADRNFWFRNDSVQDTVAHVAENTAWGGVAGGIGGPLVPAAVNAAGQGFQFLGRGAHSIATWVAPRATERLLESAPAGAVRSTYNAVAGAAGNARNWVTAGGDEIGTVLTAPPSAQNFVNMYSRAYLPAFALPAADGASHLVAINEWERVNGYARQLAADVRRQQQRRAQGDQQQR